MRVANKTFEHLTKGELDFIDITQEVGDFVKESGIRNGLVNIQTLHTTAAVILNENEPFLMEDIKNNLENIAAKDISYGHNDRAERTVNVCVDECLNGHSHCRAIHLPTSLTINLISGELQLGQWQSILFVELDHSRKRKVQAQIIGE